MTEKENDKPGETAMATPGMWKQIGNEGEWSGTVAACTLNNRLHTIKEYGNTNKIKA